MFRYHNLNQTEAHIIEQKGTERPFTGQYDKVFHAGVYVCKKCDFPLFLSESKFDAGCGWPSFDDAIDSHVMVQKDKDGIRDEILCQRCHGHLGHVFKGEHLTAKNTRHCVNSVSLHFLPAFTSEGFERAVLAAGCFWGVEHLLKDLAGVMKIKSGYTGGHVVNPSYEEVCSGTTGHQEAVEVLFDPDILSYQDLLKAFFEIHDFTQTNGQGPDIGSQYLSKIFVFSHAQKKTAHDFIELLRKKGFKVSTTVEHGMPFYPAEDYHQEYYLKTGKTPYCHIRKPLNL
jgi:peptide methionine sulfoxide reductase msrA/msrB